MWWPSCLYSKLRSCAVSNPFVPFLAGKYFPFAEDQIRGMTVVVHRSKNRNLICNRLMGNIYHTIFKVFEKTFQRGLSKKVSK